MQERLYAVQTVVKLDNRIINQKLILFSAQDEHQAKAFVDRDLKELNDIAITQTVAVSVQSFPMGLVVSSANGGTKIFKITEME